MELQLPPLVLSTTATPRKVTHYYCKIHTEYLDLEQLIRHKGHCQGPYCADFHVLCSTVYL